MGKCRGGIGGVVMRRMAAPACKGPARVPFPTMTSHLHHFRSSLVAWLTCSLSSSVHIIKSFMMEPKRIPQRELQKSKPISIIGLGCSSFSNLFLPENDPDASLLNEETLRKDHEKVIEWIKTIHYAISEAGITLLDTAPWYGQGISERVIGWALHALQLTEKQRGALCIQTKVSRYLADPKKQFDFSYDMTIRSVQRSLERLQCGYIDCVQIHDPEFAPSLAQIMATLEALRFAMRQGWCRSIGLTGYPLAVQHQIMEASLKRFGINLFDRSLTYCHFNLHDTSLVLRPLPSIEQTFFEYCKEQKIAVLVAAPLSMGLLTTQGPPSWHPAPAELKAACKSAAEVCDSHGVDISTLALLFALSNPQLPCTILGMKSVDEVMQAQSVANRLQDLDPLLMFTQDRVLEAVLTEQEKACLKTIRDPEHGPFASVWKSGLYQWDGVQEAKSFWSQIENAVIQEWQTLEN
jgi:L-galactose dehydrogenase